LVLRDDGVSTSPRHLLPPPLCVDGSEFASNPNGQFSYLPYLLAPPQEQRSYSVFLIFLLLVELFGNGVCFQEVGFFWGVLVFTFWCVPVASSFHFYSPYCPWATSSFHCLFSQRQPFVHWRQSRERRRFFNLSPAVRPFCFRVVPLSTA